MKIYFEPNQQTDFNKSYSVFEKELEQLLKNADSDKEEVNKVKKVIFKGINLQRYKKELVEIEVFYQDVSNSIFITWIFLISEMSIATEGYTQDANDMLRDLGMKGIMEYYKKEKKIFEEYQQGQSQEVLDTFPTSAFYLISEFENPIHITKGNTKIHYKQNYKLK